MALIQLSTDKKAPSPKSVFFSVAFERSAFLSHPDFMETSVKSALWRFAESRKALSSTAPLIFTSDRSYPFKLTPARLRMVIALAAA